MSDRERTSTWKANRTECWRGEIERQLDFPETPKPAGPERNRAFGLIRVGNAERNSVRGAKRHSLIDQSSSRPQRPFSRSLGCSAWQVPTRVHANLLARNDQPVNRIQENRQIDSVAGEVQTNELSLTLSIQPAAASDQHRPKNQLNKLRKTSAAGILHREFGFAGSVHRLADDFMQQFYNQNETFRSSRCHTPA